MALCLSPLPTSIPSFPQTTAANRKRTSSFCFHPPSPSQLDMSPRPTKAPRLSRRSGLKRTASFLDMSDDAASTLTTATAKDALHAGLAHDRPPPRLKVPSNVDSCTYGARLSKGQSYSSCSDPATALINRGPTASSSSSRPPPPPHQRTTSPLAPIQSSRLERPTFPRSKHHVDLHRKAVTTSMLRTPEGQRFLHMGPRLAFSIADATKELEKIVAATIEPDGDTFMGDASAAPSSGLGNSWVFVPGEDWEMLSCN